MKSGEDVILRVVNLKKYFPLGGWFFKRRSGYVKAVDGVDLEIYRGETAALVGESGCGKTTLGRTILRLIEPTSGEIYFEGVNLLKLSKGEMRKMRMNMQLVQQDPQSALDPRMTVKASVGEPLVVHGIARGRELRRRVLHLLRRVGLGEEHMNRFPQEFSGGQRQRICIARALALNPKFIVLDEPTSSLDVSVQAQILNLLKDLQRDLGLTYLFISHNLSVVRYISDHVYVMYLGNIVEKAETREIFKNPLHPYTRTLFSAVPIPDPNLKRKRLSIKGEVPSAIDPPPGCRFHPRCPEAMEVCSRVKPELREVEPGHQVACHLYR
ncbi:ABC transporter ATP-binding protein [Candidatus Bathyarchaeota archaeon]|nr:MAG: ABC transporter ATP-binding protein [Candidatus Bathyarchaeota archaeon]